MTVQPPNTLAELQRWLAALILDAAGTEGEAGRRSSLTDTVCGADRAFAAERLNAYVGGYPARLREALVEAYPATEHVVGAATFAEAVKRYRAWVPDRIYSLGDVGARFEDFLRGDELGGRFAFLADLARLEWAVQASFHARLQPVLDPAPLAEWQPEQWEHAVLHFQAGVAVVDSQWPILDVWRARETPVEEIAIDVDGRPQCVLVHRSGYKVSCRDIGSTQGRVLLDLLVGEPLGHVMERSEQRGDDPSAVMAWFSAWMQTGLVTACTTDTPG